MREPVSKLEAGCMSFHLASRARARAAESYRMVDLTERGLFAEGG